MDGSDEPTKPIPGAKQNPLPDTGFGSDRQPLAAIVMSEADGTRTRNHRIDRPRSRQNTLEKTHVVIRFWADSEVKSYHKSYQAFPC